MFKLRFRSIFIYIHIHITHSYPLGRMRRLVSPVYMKRVRASYRIVPNQSRCTDRDRNRKASTVSKKGYKTQSSIPHPQSSILQPIFLHIHPSIQLHLVRSLLSFSPVHTRILFQLICTYVRSRLFIDDLYFVHPFFPPFVHISSVPILLHPLFASSVYIRAHFLLPEHTNVRK